MNSHGVVGVVGATAGMSDSFYDGVPLKPGTIIGQGIWYSAFQ